VAHIDISPLAASLAVTNDVLVPALFQDDKLRFWILARFAKHEFVDEAIKQFTEAFGIVCTVDNIAIVLLIKRSLSAKLASKEFGWVTGRATKGSRDIGHVGNNGLDTIAFTLNFGGEQGHTVVGMVRNGK
jgi:hypothetical protein